RFVRETGGRKDERAELVAVLAADHHVTHVRRAVLEEARAQRPDIDPGAGGELEVLRHPAAEHEALAGIVGRLEDERVAEAVVPLLVERLRGELGLAPVAWRDARAPQPHLVAR